MAEITVLRVAHNSDPGKVAGALSSTIREKGAAILQAIGAGAANQALKAVAISRGHWAPAGVDLVCRPHFVDLQVEGNERTAMCLEVAPKDPIKIAA
jgi:stage V sporulation protein S